MGRDLHTGRHKINDSFGHKSAAIKPVVATTLDSRHCECRVPCSEEPKLKDAAIKIEASQG